MCVLNRRADVAKICLGKMGLFRGARALRAVDQDNPDTKIAILAIHLNMKVCFNRNKLNNIVHSFLLLLKEEAEKILLQSKQYDLLNQLYQSINEWEKAIDIATHYDRIHLRNTFYNYAKSLEQNNQLDKAIEL
jgi:intraflagellar transport protein 140